MGPECAGAGELRSDDLELTTGAAAPSAGAMDMPTSVGRAKEETKGGADAEPGPDVLVGPEGTSGVGTSCGLKGSDLFATSCPDEPCIRPPWDVPLDGRGWVAFKPPGNGTEDACDAVADTLPTRVAGDFFVSWPGTAPDPLSDFMP
mmetsp:Transcript_10172/g.61994  ORF Transcript_10172/g.61994 Transcript_10172/m.61994 type:complete len:147 (-) Transcript_10172:2772-3212(-)